MNKSSISNNDFMNWYLNIRRQIKNNKYDGNFHEPYFDSSSKSPIFYANQNAKKN